MKRLVTLTALLFAACGDDIKGQPDAAMPDSQEADAMVDAPVLFTQPTPVEIALATAGPDQIMAVKPGPSGSFYAAGYAATTSAGAKMLVIAKLTSAGALDTSFASPNGFFTSALEFKGGSDEIDLVVQSNGDVVVAGTIANDVDPTDKDIGLFRVTSAGALDLTFGGSNTGMSRVNLSTAYDDAGTKKYLDAERDLALGPSDTLFLHAIARNDVDNGGMRQDSDFAVARLTAAGVLDGTYGTSGKFLLNLSETDNVATPRGLHVLSDGSVIASGYAKTTTSNGTAQPVLYKVVPGGTALDTGFATGGLFHEVVLSMQTEIYAFAISGNHLTTAGYGRETGTANVWASLRFKLNDGTRDTNFGGATNGVVTVDPSGALAGANCRNAIGLPGGKTALIGSLGGTGMRDAAVVILTETGALDTSFGTGVHTYSLNGAEDQFWGGAVSGGKLLIGGWKGFGATQSDTANDNGHAVVYGLE